MRIPEQKIEEVRITANIVDVISHYVQLRKRGKNFIGLCPFHQEKTPSFTVSEDKQIFHCFGCHEGGNVFKFLMGFKRISFLESVIEIADSYGIAIEYDESNKDALSDQESLYEINVLAAKFFSKTLLKDPQAEIARKYFENRSIKPQSVKSFGLGYAPDTWDSFLQHAEKNKVDLEKAKSIGLIDVKDKGGYYDKFRGRIIFPILSPNGRVIAFGGRILDNTLKTAKYLNSPESKIYQKRYSLYGLYHSQDEIRRRNKAILVEGYMDVISLYQSGIKNVIASSGTALTAEQVQLLSRYTKNIVVMFDSDAAGQNAAMRSIEILLKQDFDVKVLSLPEGEDPDSFVIKNGKEIFEEKINSAVEFLEYQTSQFKKKGMFDETATTTEAIRQLVQTVSFVDDQLKRSILIKNISRKFNLREKLIESELDKYLRENKRRDNRAQQRQAPPRQEVHELPPPPDDDSAYAYQEAPPMEETVEINPSIVSVEKELIKLLFSGNEPVIGFIFDNIMAEDFSNPQFRKIADIICELYKKDIFAPSVITDNIKDDALRIFLIEMTVAEETISKKWDELAAGGKVTTDIEKHTIDAVVKFRTLKLDEHIKTATARMSSTTDDSNLLELMGEIHELQQEKKNLINSKKTMAIQ